MSNKQVEFFNVGSNQYNVSFIQAPPFHTQQEIYSLITKIEQDKKETIIDFGSGSGRVCSSS